MHFLNFLLLHNYQKLAKSCSFDNIFIQNKPVIYIVMNLKNAPLITESHYHTKNINRKDTGLASGIETKYGPDNIKL